MQKSATVVTNDPETTEFQLTMQGVVESFATITPAFLRLYGNVGQKISGNVAIWLSEKYPFNILEAKAQNGQYIRLNLEKDMKGNQPGYTLTVENLMVQEGRYFDTIQLKTDSNIKPYLTVKVYGNIFEPPDERNKPNQSQNH